MKKLFLSLSVVLGVLSLSAMEKGDASLPEEGIITLVASNGQKFTVPASFAQESETLQTLMGGLTEEATTQIIQFTDIHPNILKIIADIASAAHIFKNAGLSNKALLDAIAQKVSLVPSIVLLKAFDFLGYELGKNLVARTIAADDLNLNSFTKQNLEHLKPLIARYYYLLRRENLPGIAENNYGFSIQDYIDYQPQLITAMQNENRLDLSNMRLNCLEGFSSIPNLKTLQWLDLDNNQLSELPLGIFSGLTSLQNLSIDNNNLGALPLTIFNGLSALQWLSLGNNELITLPAGVFNGLPNLQELYLSNNKLRTLTPETFNGLANVKRINLSNNQLSTLPTGIFNGLANLQALNLVNNQLSALPVEIFASLANLRGLFLNHNKLSAVTKKELKNALTRVAITF